MEERWSCGWRAACDPSSAPANTEMRTVSATASVRLYYLDDGDAIAVTLFYGTLAEALMVARQQPEETQAALWLATENDVVAFVDMEDG